MPESFLDKIVDKLKNLGSGLKGFAAAVIAAVLFMRLISLFSCHSGPMFCGNLQDFSVIAPIYLLFMSVAPHMSNFMYVFLYMLSTAFYAAIAYYAVELLQLAYTRFKDRPRITLKRI